ncbi:MAG: hypothetical protein IJ029_07635 [Lachnospiraceae bacterium]|nr:hypothetical protein [Lachnospiraceae bacterium]
MAKMKPLNQQKTCPSCGAPVVSEICAYCGMATGLNTAEADMEYPVLECKAAALNFWTVWFPAIFAVSFGIVGLSTLIVGITGFGDMTMVLIGIPFSLIGIVAAFLVIRTLWRYLVVKKNGKLTRATVYGYMDDSVLINDRPAQIVKLLVQTPNGPRFILYKLGNTLRPYGVNDNIDILVYQSYFLITKKKEAVQW